MTNLSRRRIRRKLKAIRKKQLRQALIDKIVSKLFDHAWEMMAYGETTIDGVRYVL